MEIVSIVIAGLALVLSGFTFHRQFFHRKYSLKLAVGWLPKPFDKEGKRINGLSLVLTNSGTIPVIITKFDLKYRTSGTKDSGSYLTPNHEVFFDIQQQRILAGDHLVARVYVSDQFPGGKIEMTESDGCYGPDNKSLIRFNYPVELLLEYLDDDGQLKYSCLDIGVHSFSPEKKHEGFQIPAKPQEIYTKG